MSHIEKEIPGYPVIRLWLITLKVEDIIFNNDWCNAFARIAPELTNTDIRQWVMFLHQNKELGKKIKAETGFRWNEHLERNAATGSDAVKEFALFTSLYPNPTYASC